MTVTAIIQLLVVVAMLLLAYQDFKYRAVHWMLFPLLFLLCSFHEIIESSWQIWLEQLTVNVIFIALQLILLTVYFSIRSKKWTSIFDRFIGWGDVLALVVFAAAFTPVVFMTFVVSGLLLVLIIYGIKIAFSQNTSELIPLAGCLGVLYVFCNGLFIFFPEMGNADLLTDGLQTMLQ